MIPPLATKAGKRPDILSSIDAGHSVVHQSDYAHCAEDKVLLRQRKGSGSRPILVVDKPHVVSIAAVAFDITFHIKKHLRQISVVSTVRY